MNHEPLSVGTIHRLNLYLHYLKDLPWDILSISPKDMAQALSLPLPTVRQDLKDLLQKENIENEDRDALLNAAGRYLSLRSTAGVILVGAGKLGSALMSYAGFSVYGLDIMAGFDINAKIIRRGVCGKPVYPVDQLGNICRTLHAEIGIITVPGGHAQTVCDALVSCGIIAIWNFTSANLKVPPHVLVRNEDLSASLCALAKHASKH
ncbi:MAG: redox-sensing transcriptional repressor Rex [Solobacterium sp.]|jgi:redox-sensing transcriptional repressor|nr:redox-sensing transcriptional repressor Rex [Solobacterium sp.]MCH4205977.1 redox-sensing transcriptional repressor Rex [Solobacterium sp.]MCH4227415.1 redox-sensing transcriptional repressor Rex [Solobacterium sp.]MCH4282784.1 redox-sensing transcriptional repressor Rex [Solobacterium sp.]